MTGFFYNNHSMNLNRQKFLMRIMKLTERNKKVSRAVVNAKQPAIANSAQIPVPFHASAGEGFV